MLKLIGVGFLSLLALFGCLKLQEENLVLGGAVMCIGFIIGLCLVASNK